MNKRAFFKIKGMQRDLSASAFTSEYAYENKNIRIMPTDESTLFSIVNERGTKLADINGLENNLKGVPIGQAVIDNELIIFSAGDQSLKTIEDITKQEATFAFEPCTGDSRYFINTNKDTLIISNQSDCGDLHGEKEWLDLKKLSQFLEIRKTYIDKFIKKELNI